MKVRAYVLVLALTACYGCSKANPVQPDQPPAPISLTGQLAATQSLTALPGQTITVGGLTAQTNSAGQFTLTLTNPATTLTVSGSNVLTRTTNVSGVSHAFIVDAVQLDGQFDLAYYRQLARNAFDGPTTLEPIRRWTRAPVFDVQTINDKGQAVDPVLLAQIKAAISEVTLIWSGGLYSAGFGAGGVPVRWLTTLNGFCGQAPVGPTGTFIELHPLEPRCDMLHTVKHEVGHVMGFWHTNIDGDLMKSGSTAQMLSARERYHAAIVYRRPAGNVDPDNDAGLQTFSVTRAIQ